MSLDGVVVSKPWGYEYLCYRNSAVAIWFLHITCGQRTSLHCHPNKHTGFVVLQGSVRIRFLRGGSELTGLDKIHIFRARFHSTEALSKSGAYILEIETPEDKHDLVRLDDSYGRAGTAYEGKEHHRPKSEREFWLPDPDSSPNRVDQMHGCRVQHKLVKSASELCGLGERDIVVVTGGGLSAGAQSQILWPGDVVDGISLDRLSKAFEIIDRTTVLLISPTGEEM